MTTPANAVSTPLPMWDASNPSGSLEALFSAASGVGEERIRWYKDRACSLRFGSRLCRGAAIILIGIGSLLPLVTAAGTALGWNPQNIFFGFGYVAFLLAAGCLGFDRFFGLSTGWLRFIKTQLVLEGGLDQFRFDWAALLAKAAGPQPAPAQIQVLLKRLQVFVQFVNAQVQQETNAWILEFQTNVADLAKEAEAHAQGQNLGQVQVSVSNAKDLDEAFTASLDGAESQRADGGQCTFFNVPPGDHRVVAKGAKAGQPHQDSTTITVPPGGKNSVSLTLTPS